MTYLRNLWSALVQDGDDLDITENACLDGLPGMTISMRCALANKAGRLWAHVACIFLSLAVQWRHCEKQIQGVPMGPISYTRAIIALIGVPYLLIRLGIEAARFAFRLF